MTRQNPGRAGPRSCPPRSPAPPPPPRRTDLSYSDRVRNMARAEGGSGYAGSLRANTSPPAPSSPAPPQREALLPTARALATPSARPPVTASDWLVVVPADVIGPTCLPARPRLVSGRAGPGPSGRFTALVVARGAPRRRRVERVPPPEEVRVALRLAAGAPLRAPCEL